ncbi:Methyl-accepting chemotaxis protein OS=Lysinibacillus sphaericus OX=1421 GN=LS41612_18135 PE=3 SV=1 [Lysinibacillus sphaericus]
MKNSQIISIIAIIIGVALGIFLMLYVHRKVTTPLKSVVAAANNIANGELYHQDITNHSKDEIGQLAIAFNTMKSNLSNLMTHIQNNSEHLTGAAEELTASTEEVSATTEEVSSRIS